MNRISLALAALLGALLPLLLDSALKGAALLALAALCTLALFKASAATRHLVWLVAVVALLIVPLLSVALPQWRILPKWKTDPIANPTPAAPIVAAVLSHPERAPVVEPAPPAPTEFAPPPSLPAAAQPPVAPAPAPALTETPTRSWREWLALTWLAVFGLLSLRLLAAHFLLRRAARNCLLPAAGSTGDGRIVDAFAALRAELSIRQRVTLLLDAKRTIPLVWGVFRPHLLLPAEARGWGDQQLRSVLLHELAHIKRRDPLVQWLTQIACALHWWNPLVWLAAWRIHVERERACDDLVLASGVRPSAYAEHLLHIATRLSPARWTQSCGLAMARKSALEGRLHAVLSEKLNRRRVSATIGAAALLLGAGIAIPVAMLRAAEDNPAAPATAMQPEHEPAQALFKRWQASARADGKIPGGLIAGIAKKVDGFTPEYGEEAARKLAALRPKIDASRDWPAAEAVALLDEICAISTAPVEWLNLDELFDDGTLQRGAALPADLIDAAWGPPAENGLRAAWLLDPRADQYALGSVLKARVLFHNSGEEPVVFKTEKWHQDDPHVARDAKGAEINVKGTWYTGVTPLATFRLEPGEYCEVQGHGIAIGAGEYVDEHSTGSVGVVINAKQGDEVRFSSTVNLSTEGWKRPDDPKDPAELWKKRARERIGREAPLPLAAADRELLVRHVTRDLFGVEPTAEEIAAFTTAAAPDALENLEQRLLAKPRIEPFVGKLPTGEIKFRVTAADPDAAGAPVQDEAAKQQNGAKFQFGNEGRLKWGEPVNGLRMALAWPPLISEPWLGDAEEFYLLVQNVSQAAVRFTTGAAAPIPRRLSIREHSKVLTTIGDEQPMVGDWLLQPHEVAFVRMFTPVEKVEGKLTVSAAIEQDVRLTPAFSMTAEMAIEKAPAGAWTGELKTGETRGSVDVIPPKHKEARALYKSWATASRANGDIPGALIGQLAESVKTFIKNNPTWETTPQLEKMLPDFDATQGWVAQDAVALLDRLAAVQDSPIKAALEIEQQGIIRTGAPLPPELADAPWGEALPNGLRHAWLLEPRAAEHRLSTALKARVLIHNAGKEPLVFRTRTWHQLAHKASDATGAEISTESTRWLTRGLLLTYRLAPGEFVEVDGPGIGVGPKGDPEDWQETRVGTWIEAKAGDEVTVTTAPLPLMDWNEEGQLKFDGEPRWWLDFIKARLSRHLPLPADKSGRERLLYRVALELFGTPYNDDAFVADTTPGALDALALRIFHRAGQQAWAGPLESAPTKFRVLPADPDAAKKPRTANGPGRYTLGENLRLVVTRRPDGERIVNHGSVTYYPPGKNNITHDLKLPDGHQTWAAAWVRGETQLWLTQKGLVRKIDFTNPAKVEETRFGGDEGTAAPIPADIREALLAAFIAPDARNPKEEKEGADAGRPFQEKLDTLDEKMAALQAERERLLRSLDPLRPMTRELKEKIEMYERAFQAAVEAGSDPSKVGAPASETPETEKAKDGADAEPADDGDAQAGVPAADRGKMVKWSGELGASVSMAWGEEQRGLRLGMHVADDADWRIGSEVKVELWIANSGGKEVKFESTGRNDLGLRVLMTGEDGVEHAGSISVAFLPIAFDQHLLQPEQAVKVRELTVIFVPPGGQFDARLQPHFGLPPGDYRLRCEHDLFEGVVTAPDGKRINPVVDRWIGTLKSAVVDVTLDAADAGAKAAEAKVLREWAEVGIARDGSISLKRKPVTLDQLKTEAGQHPERKFVIDADQDVPYAKVVEVADALRGVGATFSYRDGRMGDTTLRVANRTGNYEFDGVRSVSICRPSQMPQWFTVGWPAEGQRPNCWLRTYPNVSDETLGKWAVAWAPGADVLWWVDDTDIGKMTLTDPARVIVDREGRTNNFSRDFGLPEEVKTEFRRLGFVIGRDKTPGLENAIGGNTGGQSIVSAEFGNWIIKGTVTDADGEPLADVPVRVRAQFTPTLDTATAKTDVKGEYRLAFRLPLTTLAAFRGVRAEPVRDGFVERDLAKSGEFNVLLRAGEKPRRPGDENAPYIGPENFAPGPIPRFAERDLLPSPPGVTPGKPGRADFVMVEAGDITGVIVDANGNLVSGCGIAVSAEGQRNFDSVAATGADEKGRFRLTGVPLHKPLFFTLSPTGRLDESQVTALQMFAAAAEHELRITVSQKGTPKVERTGSR